MGPSASSQRALIAVAWAVMVFVTSLSSLSRAAEAVPASKTGATEATQPTSIQVVVDGRKTIATVGDEFICATLDWWPATKCNYGSCPWYNVSLLNLDLTNPILEQAVAALAPLRIRLGGTLQDVIQYDIGALRGPCLPLMQNNSAMFGFSGGCLSMSRWDLLNRFFKKTGCSVAFGLNTLYGRSSSGVWDPSNAAEFILYTHDQGYPITAWELGNELMGGNGVGLQIPASVYATNVMMLRTIVNRIYERDVVKPLVVAPDAFYYVDNPDYYNFLEESGPYVVDVMTRHIYNLGPGSSSSEQLVDSILNRSIADEEEDRYVSLQAILGNFPWATAWIGESGGAYNSGHENITDAFIMAFWYLDQLGLASKHNNKAFCRQSLIGGHYGLLDPINYMPNPDFYGALLWHKLMGKGVLWVNINSLDIRAYAHCEKKSTKGGVTVVLLNYSNMTSYSIDLSIITSNMSEATTCMEPIDNLLPLEYHMSPKGGDIYSRVVLLNGKPLQLTHSGGLPLLEGQAVNSSKSIFLEPLTYTFLVLPSCTAVACSND